MKKGEFPVGRDYKSAKEMILYLIERDWGPRCNTTDFIDFPDLNENSRCPVCLVYEQFDKFWEVFARYEDD